MLGCKISLPHSFLKGHIFYWVFTRDKEPIHLQTYLKFNHPAFSTRVLKIRKMCAWLWEHPDHIFEPYGRSRKVPGVLLCVYGTCSDFWTDWMWSPVLFLVGTSMTFLLSLKKLKLELNKLCSKEYYFSLEGAKENCRQLWSFVILPVEVVHALIPALQREEAEVSECEANLANQG